jgi:hypothetical protein
MSGTLASQARASSVGSRLTYQRSQPGRIELEAAPRPAHFRDGGVAFKSWARAIPPRGQAGSCAHDDDMRTGAASPPRQRGHKSRRPVHARGDLTEADTVTRSCCPLSAARCPGPGPGACGLEA